MGFSHTLDALISSVSPGLGARRAESRLREVALRKAQDSLSSYFGADRSRLRSDWWPGNGSADQDLLDDLPTLRERCRDLNRNNGIAASITGTMVNNVIGSGIRPQSRPDGDRIGLSDEQVEEFESQAEYLFEKWKPYADAGNRLSFDEIQEQACRQIFENGDCLVIPRMIPGRKPFEFCLQLVEGDRLDTPQSLRNVENIRGGVKIGANGEPVSYFVLNQHPGDWGWRKTRQEFQEIPASQALHLYWQLRPGQSRGVPFFAPVMSLFKDLGDYLEAEIVAARVGACLSVFIKTDVSSGNPWSQGAVVNAAGQTLNQMEPGMMFKLNPGESIESFMPNRPGNTFGPFVELLQRSIGAALGLPYELVAKDFSKTNYSSARAALLDARRLFRVKQRWFSQRLCQPVWELFLESALYTGELRARNFLQFKSEYCQARWIAAGWEWVDPAKEVKASTDAIAANLSTLATECAAKGDDWEDVLRQRAKEKSRVRNLGLVEEIMPGVITKKDNPVGSKEDDDAEDDDE